MTPSELDDLFRSNSERSDFTPHHEEWKQMSALLDADAKRERNNRVVSIFWMMLFLSLITWGTFSLVRSANLSTPSADIQQVPQANNFQNTTAHPSYLDTALEPNFKFEPAIASQPDAATELTTTQPQSAQPAPFAMQQSAAKSTASTVTAVLRATPANATLANTASGAPALDIPSDAHKDAGNLVNLPSPDLRHLNSNNADLIDAELPAIGTPRPVKITSKAAPRFSVGAFAAGEASAVGMSEPLRWGARAGIVVHAAVLRHWELQLGLSYGRKCYEAGADDYAMPAGFWYNDIPAANTKSKTDVFEVPVLATYHFRQNNTSGLFASAGLTSYFLNRESFDYEYQRYDPNARRELQMRNVHKNILSVAQVQLGYRLVTSHGLAYRLAPFVSIPFGGVGYTGVQLYSGGIGLEVEWR